MNQNNSENLDDVILEEKHLVAREHFLDAWEAGLLDGIDPEIIARELVRGALRQYTSAFGSNAAAEFIEELRTEEQSGEFIAGKSVQ